jgi:hypothetical protein
MKDLQLKGQWCVSTKYNFKSRQELIRIHSGTLIAKWENAWHVEIRRTLSDGPTIFRNCTKLKTHCESPL